MINALHSSCDGGTRQLTLDGIWFGWNTIINMYERECQRVRNGNARMVPKLREVHIIRDSWTKLNVSPAKIMQVRFGIAILFISDYSIYCHLSIQQEQVLGELFNYISQNPVDAVETKATLQYLESCHKLLFEKGFLSHDRIFGTDAAILKSINEGYLFFAKWHQSLIQPGQRSNGVYDNNL